MQDLDKVSRLRLMLEHQPSGRPGYVYQAIGNNMLAEQIDQKGRISLAIENNSRAEQRTTHRSSMQSARITPDRACLLRPVHPRNTVVVSRDYPHDIISDHLVFVCIDIVDSSDVQSNTGEQRLPACDGMCADNGVVWCKFVNGV